MAVALHPNPVGTFGYVTSAIAGAAFVLWRRAPLAFLAIALGAVCAYTVSDAEGGPIYTAVFIAAMNLAAQTRETRNWLPWTVAAAGALLISELVVGDVAVHLFPVLAPLV